MSGTQSSENSNSLVSHSTRSVIRLRSGLEVESPYVLPRSRSRSRSCSQSQGISGNFGNHSNSSSENVLSRNFGDSNSSDVSMQSLQTGSFFRRLCWWIWTCIYLSIIWNISFEVWLLSRLHAFGKFKCVFILFTVFLLIILWGCPESQNSLVECVNTFLSFTSSSAILGLKMIAGTLKCHSDEDTEFCHVADNTQESGILNALNYFVAYVFGKNSEKQLPVQENVELPKTLIEENKKEGRLRDNKISTEELLKIEKKFNERDTKELKTEVEKLIQKSKEENRIFIRELLKELNTEVEKLTQKSKEENRIFIRELLKEEMKIFDVKYNDLHQTTKELDTDAKKKFIEVEKLSLQLSILSTAVNKLNEKVQLSNQQWDAILNSANNLEADLITALKKIMNSESQETSQYQFFHNWLDTKIGNHESLEFKSKHPSDKDLKIVIEQILMDTLKARLPCDTQPCSKDLLVEEKFRKMIKEAIQVYDADKTGKADYALESGGGSVIGTRCSETYVEKSGTVSVLGIPLWSNYNTPRTVIQPTMQPGECWAFKGSQGFLVLELSSMIYPSGFSVEHIPANLSPLGSIDSAPKDFSVWGLSSKEDNIGKILGKFSYDIKGEPLQYFPIEHFSTIPFQYVELKIHSNHGNIAYTCLYRFRVHGTRV